MPKVPQFQELPISTAKSLMMLQDFPHLKKKEGTKETKL